VPKEPTLIGNVESASLRTNSDCSRGLRLRDFLGAWGTAATCCYMKSPLPMTYRKPSASWRMLRAYSRSFTQACLQMRPYD
jgi:hypothetical protein